MASTTVNSDSALQLSQELLVSVFMFGRCQAPPATAPALNQEYHQCPQQGVTNLRLYAAVPNAMHLSRRSAGRVCLRKPQNLRPGDGKALGLDLDGRYMVTLDFSFNLEENP